jgi:ribosomal protein S18 acetylase RimI-like enzyme
MDGDDAAIYNCESSTHTPDAPLPSTLPPPPAPPCCAGVPDGDSAGCYLLNVVVAEEHRGLGVGKRVMLAAMSRAVNHWGAQRLYTHVEADNEVRCGCHRARSVLFCMCSVRPRTGIEELGATADRAHEPKAPSTPGPF